MKKKRKNDSVASSEQTFVVSVPLPLGELKRRCIIRAKRDASKARPHIPGVDSGIRVAPAGMARGYGRDFRFGSR